MADYSNQKKEKVGKGIIFSDLIYVRGHKDRIDTNGRPFQTFYFIIGKDMGFMSCSYYGDVKLQDDMCLKLLKGRFCPKRTVQGQVFLNFRVESFEVWQKPQPVQQTDYSDFVAVESIIPENKPAEEIKELDWINEEQQAPVQQEEKKPEEELVDMSDFHF